MMTDSIDFPEFAETIRRNMEPRSIQTARGSFDHAEIAVVPYGMNAVSLKPFLDEYRTKPDRRTGTATVDTLGSFMDLANRFKNDDSAVFARAQVTENAISASLTAIFNYHPANGENTDAQFSDHRALYSFPTSKDFKFWLNGNRKPMGQLEFALLLEERLMDMSAVTDADRAAIEGLKPTFADPLTILELSRDLEIYSDETFKSKGKLSSGETEMKFTSEHKDATGKPVTIPDFFVIQLPLFEGGDPQRLLVRLRYRLKDAAVVWFYELYRVDQALETAFADACEHVKTLTDLPVYFGAPEAVR